MKYKHDILLVDDEESILKALMRLLRKTEYTIHTATSGQEGLTLLSQIKKPVSMIISDQRMPGMNGAEFLDKSKELVPNAIRYLLTGYSDMDALVDAINKGQIHRFISKPWNDQDLLLVIRQGIEQYELMLENKRLILLTKKQNDQLAQLNKGLEGQVEDRTRALVAKHKELEAEYYNMVRSFAAIGDNLSKHMVGHGRRVSILAQDIARAMNLPKPDAVQVEIAGLLHDIGKVGLPRQVLDPSHTNWTAKETAAYQMHPSEGQSMLRFISKMDKIGPLIRHHHEKYDGTGFPDGLSENEIPLGARIIAVADMYDKIMNTEQNYNTILQNYITEKSLNPENLNVNNAAHDAAMAYFKQQAFTEFDPDIVKTFILLVKDKGLHYKTERSHPIDGLVPGMILTRSLYSSKGRFLLPDHTVLTNDILSKLKLIHANDPIKEPIYTAVQGGE